MSGKEQLNQKKSSMDYDRGFVVADPHTVYHDAVLHSPWNHDGGGHLPERDDWSTYRYTVKDIILGVATHRFNKNTRRLEIRAYFVGEHPIFKELEPTKAMLVVFFCQAYQSGGTLELYFENGIPFDVRTLIEIRLGEIVSGHDQLIPSELGKKLFAALSDFSIGYQNIIQAQNVDMDMVCFNTYRGTWSPNHIKTLIQRGVPLRWLFKRKPEPVMQQIVYVHLVNHLRAAILEEYAVRRMEDRQMGESLGNHITYIADHSFPHYFSQSELHIDDGETWISIPANEKFCLTPVIPRSSQSIYDSLESDLGRALMAADHGVPILVLPMDFIYLPVDLCNEYRMKARENGVQWVVVGLTSAQLLSEVEMSLSLTASQADPDEVDQINVDRYPD